MGIDAAITSDFHGDGHPQSPTDVRLRELEAYYRVCRKQSDARFLLIPSEEGNTYLGGHWSIIFPQKVLWFMTKASPGPLLRQHPQYGAVYHVGSPEDVIDMVRKENGIIYQNHPRTKSSYGYRTKCGTPLLSGCALHWRGMESHAVRSVIAAAACRAQTAG
jgi:hypothetical protein